MRQLDTPLTDIISIELKITHPTPSPTGSAAKYSNDPGVGSANNLFSTWIDEIFRVNIEIEPVSLANNLPLNFIKWGAVGFSIPDNTLQYDFSWGFTGDKVIRIDIPSCGLTKLIHVEVPDVGVYSESYALMHLVNIEAAPNILAWGLEARNYANDNYPIGPKRDAIRHSMWNALCASGWSVTVAEIDAVSTGHEHDNRDDDHQQAFNSAMDLENNSVGQTVIHSTILLNPDTSAIITDLESKYLSGELWIWDGGGSEASSEGILEKSDHSKIF